MSAAALASFESRVHARTGLLLSEIPLGTEADLLGGHIVAHDRSSGTFVVFVGPPDRVDDETGHEFWDPIQSTRIVKI